jgi:hypothetical protein
LAIGGEIKKTVVRQLVEDATSAANGHGHRHRSLVSFPDIPSASRGLFVLGGNPAIGLLESLRNGGVSEPCLSISQSRTRLTTSSSVCGSVLSGITDRCKAS